MIVVTGGAGFIGSNLIAALSAADHQVAVVDRFGEDAKWRNLAKHELAAVVAPEDLFTFIDRHAADIEMIFHMGAISATTERDVDLILRTNFQLSLALWDWCARHQVRFVYASSAATYGDGENGFADDEDPVSLARLRPMNPYGWSKHLFDRRVARLVAEDRPRPPQWAGLKFFNVYGPNEYHKGGQMSVVAQLQPTIANGEAAVLFKSHRAGIPDGGQRRDFIWVGDCVDVMMWLRDSPAVNGLFNVGTGQARSFADLATAIFAAADTAPRITYVDTPEAIRDKYQYFTEARMTRLRATGYPGQFTPLEEGVRRYVRDFLATDDPYR